jgi:urease accessory protein
MVTSRPLCAASAAGRGRIEFSVVRNRTVVTRAYAESPLRLLTPRTHGSGAWVYSTTYGGGLVGGDVIDLAVRVGPGATALLATQASTKVYRSLRPCTQRLTAAVEAEGLLIVAPDPVVCFAGAQLTQEQSIELAESGSLLLIDWLSAGRLARGERWAFDHYASRIEVFRAGNRLLHDSLLLSPAHGPLAQRLRRFQVLATVVMIGPQLRTAAAAQLAALAAVPSARQPQLLCVGSPLGGEGALLRIGGASVEQVGRAVRALCCCIPSLLGDDPFARKW